MTCAGHTSASPPGDARVLEAQLGREPRGSWQTAVRCAFGKPQVIMTEPILPDGAPFPTLYYLTCPWLVDRTGELESAGAIADYAQRLLAEPALALRMRAADAEYRFRRAQAAGGEDPVPEVGIAGQRDPLATKCLHAHVAAALAGIDDPIGNDVLASVARECPDDLCARLLADSGGPRS